MGTRILAGRYELLDRIGDGGMAVVYKARCRLLNRFVAIKILKPDFIKDVKFIENFKKESQAAASMSHPNIVNVYDVGREGNINYIVMELIEGKVLSDVIKEEAPLDYRRSIEITKQIASALSLAHRNNIIHRDVKPHNVLITHDGTAKITDFGIAKAVNTSTMVDNDGMIMGSVHYFSPEQARGGYVDEKSDIYALGIVLYEMLTGRVPYDGDNPVSVALMHINNEMTPPSKLVSGIPPRLEQIVMKATDKIQVNRFKSADEMLEDLGNLEYVTSIVGDSAVGGVRRHNGTSNSAGVINIDAQGEPHAEADEMPDVGEKETDKVGKKSKSGKKFKLNKYKLVAVILALALGIPASVFLSQFFSGNNPIGGIPEVEVPNLTGMMFEQAEEELASIGLGIRLGDEVISNEHPPGSVVSQDMPEGSVVREGRTIIVNISRAPRDGTVPRIIGMRGNDAELLIESFGFQVGHRTSRPDNAPIGIVLSQTPEEGTEAEPGTVISFVVSEGRSEEQAIIPTLTGRTVDEARTALEDIGLVLGSVTTEASETYEEGRVIGQQHAAGQAISLGAAVNVTVSSGAEVTPDEPGTGEDPIVVTPPDEPAEIPFVINYTGLVENQVFWVTVVLTDEDGTRNVSNQQRIRDDFGPDFSETVRLSGRGKGTVTVIIDNNAVIRRNVNFNTGEIS